MILAIIWLSLVVVTGFAGQISLAQLTLAGVAGFMPRPAHRRSGAMPFPIAPILAALIAMVVGVVVGLPALRIRGLPVAVVTLAFAVAIEAVWFRNAEYVGTSGEDIEGPELFGLDLHARVGTDFPRVEFGLLVLAVLVMVGIGVAKLRTSTLGSEMLAVRANERSAAGAGIGVVRVKLIAFALGAFIAGLGGAMLAYFQGNVTFTAFSTFVGLTLFATAYIGGITSVSGGLVAGVFAAGGILMKLLDTLPDIGRVVCRHQRRRPRDHHRAQPRGHRRTDPHQARRPPGGPVGSAGAPGGVAEPATRGGRTARRGRCGARRQERAGQLRRGRRGRRDRPGGPERNDRRAHRTQRGREDHAGRRDEWVHSLHGRGRPRRP